MSIEYDHVIVGAGPSGLALAQILFSLDKRKRVLLVEKRDYFRRVPRRDSGARRHDDGTRASHLR
jgi:2-polyprenyl-6-methoxyphenol hydroxylase-like FAD-dependent oxidoreductase